MLTIVMYHYVRDLHRSRYPQIKGLDIELFRQQIDYLLRYYLPVAMEDVISAFHERAPLPKNAVLLTFDDGYVDHYQYVFPILDQKHIRASFFAPAKAILESRVLDVNKIQYVLASVPDKGRIVESIFQMMDQHRHEIPLESREFYLQQHAKASQFDPAEVVFINRMLQVALPEPLRSQITDQLFRHYVTTDESAFACELYMSLDQLRCMRRHGMHIGSHSYDHCCLNALDPAAQARQIDLSLEFLQLIGCDTGDWTISYPYGTTNDALLGILASKGCKVGLTTEVALAEPSRNPLLLPRLDTRDLPKDREADPSPWTQMILA
ncbi:MAG: polysaccharide deacetylase family protein [Bacillota bacterium]